MKRIFPLLFCFAFCFYGYAQFDSSGYRFLIHYDSENTGIISKFTDTNFYLLTNTGKKKEGLLIESHNLVDAKSRKIRYQFDETYNQRSISQIVIEQFAYYNGKLALFCNQGIYFAGSPEDPIKLLTADLTAFEFDGLEFRDSILYVYRNSQKTFDAFFEMVALNIKTGKIVRYPPDDDINARIYSNFRDIRLINCGNGTLFRADYVLPFLYRYSPKKDTLSLLDDSIYTTIIRPYLMPDNLMDFMRSFETENSFEYFETENSFEYLDTTIKLTYSFYANRCMSLNDEGDELTLLSSYPGQDAGFNPQFVLTEWSVSDTGIKMEKFRKIESAKKLEHPVNHAFDVINPWGVVHITQDEFFYYFIIQNATALSPAGMTTNEYYESNYNLQFENTGFGVIRLAK